MMDAVIYGITPKAKWILVKRSSCEVIDQSQQVIGTSVGSCLLKSCGIDTVGVPQRNQSCKQPGLKSVKGFISKLLYTPDIFKVSINLFIIRNIILLKQNHQLPLLWLLRMEIH